MSSFSTNAFMQFHTPGSKEFIAVQRTVLNDFKATKQFQLRSEQSVDFCNAIEKAKQKENENIEVEGVGQSVSE